MVIKLVYREEKQAPYHKLGHFMIEGFPAGPAGSQRIRVTFNIDEVGQLSVTARDLNRSDDEARMF